MGIVISPLQYTRSSEKKIQRTQDFPRSSESDSASDRY